MFLLICETAMKLQYSISIKTNISKTNPNIFSSTLSTKIISDKSYRGERGSPTETNNTDLDVTFHGH